MIDRLRKIFRRFPIVFNFLSMIYQTFFAPVVSGHTQYFIKYLFLIRKKEIKHLKKYGLTKVRPFRHREWRIGKGKDKAFRRYYLAEYNNEKCFVKIGTNDATVKNECCIMEKLKKGIFDFSPRYVIGDSAFETDTVMVAVSFVEGLSKFFVPNHVEMFGEVCRQFLNILDVLKEYDMVHADIHKGNLMMCGNKLYLMDYGISMIKSVGNNINYVSRPGTFYGVSGQQRTYDDAYSFVKMIEQQGISEEFENNSFYQEIKRRVGENYFTVVC